jgi:hypothetical protein
VELLHCLDILLRRLVDVIIGVVQLVVLEVTCSTATVSDTEIIKGCIDLRVGRVTGVRAVLLVDSSDDVSIDLATTHSFHHCQMLEIVVRLEQSVAGEEFDQDAPYAPDVAGEAPAKVEYDLWCTVMPC